MNLLACLRWISKQDPPPFGPIKAVCLCLVVSGHKKANLPVNRLLWLLPSLLTKYQ